jgi:hypothetical protein
MERKLKPISIPAANDEKKSELAGRSSSSTAGARIFSWISSALSLVPVSG